MNRKNQKRIHRIPGGRGEARWSPWCTSTASQRHRSVAARRHRHEELEKEEQRHQNTTWHVLIPRARGVFSLSRHVPASLSIQRVAAHCPRRAVVHPESKGTPTHGRIPGTQTSPERFSQYKTTLVHPEYFTSSHTCRWL